MSTRSIVSIGIVCLVVQLVLVFPPIASTVVIDRVNDLDLADTYATTTVGTTAFVTADANYLYLGYDGPQISSPSANNWLLAFVGADGVGTTAGPLFNTQRAVFRSAPRT